MNSEEQGRTRENYSDLDQFFLGFIERKANSVEERLRRQLKGKIKITFRDQSKVYLFDGSADTFTVKAENPEVFDAQIEMHSKDIELIAEDRLNVQIAMLSGQIKVSGNIQLTVYFFNLF